MTQKTFHVAFLIGKVVLVLGSLAAIPVVIFMAFVEAGEPPGVTVGQKFYDVTDTLGTPTDLYLNGDRDTVNLRYRYGVFVFSQLLSIEVNTSGTIVKVLSGD